MNELGDMLFGGDGNDTLAGASDGPDTLTGGQGADHFEVQLFGFRTSTITDFVTGVDKLVFNDAGVFGQPVGVLAARQFVANADGVAQNSDHRVVYNTSTGLLSYDPDGSGRLQPDDIIRLAPGLALSHRDILFSPHAVEPI